MHDTKTPTPAEIAKQREVVAALEKQIRGYEAAEKRKGATFPLLSRMRRILVDQRRRLTQMGAQG